MIPNKRLKGLRVSTPQAQRCVTELKSQVNRLEAEVDEQRTHKQIAMVENEQLRMEVETLRGATAAGVGAQIGMKEADSECTDWGLQSQSGDPPDFCFVTHAQRGPRRPSCASRSSRRDMPSWSPATPTSWRRSAATLFLPEWAKELTFSSWVKVLVVL